MELFNIEYADNNYYHYINNNLEYSKHLPYYFESMGKSNFKPGSYTKRKNIFFFVLLFTVSGKGVLNYMNQEIECTPNTVCFIDCYKYNDYHTLPDHNWEYYWIILNGCGVEAYFNYMFSSKYDCINLEPNKFSEIIDMIKTIEQIYIKRNNVSDVLISSYLDKILSLLAQNTINSNKISYFDVFYSINKYIFTNLNRKIYANELANYANIPLSNLQRKIKYKFGLTIMDYVKKERLKTGKNLLINSDLSIENISASIGISNAGRFIRYFKQEYGETPNEYRKRHKQ